MNFNHLHVHSTYSFLDGYGLPHQYIEQLKVNKQTCIGLTDHGSTWGHVPFFFELKKEGLNCILGCEFYYDRDVTEMNKSRYHITLLAKNKNGLLNLYQLLTMANFEGFYYKPRIDDNMLKKYSKDIIVLSGCMGDGFPIRNIENGKSVMEWMKMMKGIFGENFYCEISPIAKYKNQIRDIISISDKLKIPIAITSDVHFPAKDHHTPEDIMLSIGLKAEYHDSDRMRLMPELYLYDDIELLERLDALFKPASYKKYLSNTSSIVDKCKNIELPPAKPLKYKIDDPEKLFKTRIKQGWKTRSIDPVKNKIYKDRCDYEFKMIKEKNFIDYFLIIADLVVWAKQHMVVGAARGSVAGSLIAWLLQITEVDPLKHGLLFERFIDVTRKDLPDIDLDFPHTKRNMVVDHLIKKYGEDHVSLLGTVNYFKSKNAIWDVGRIFDLPWNERKALAEMIMERSSGDSRSSFCIADSMNEFEEAKKIIKHSPEFKLAADIEGQARQSGVHAAAIVISNEPLIQHGSFINNDGYKVLCMDKYAAEKIGLLKIDVLALKQLTVIDNILSLIKKNNDWLYSLPLNDPKPYTILKDHLFQGIFQFEGDALKVVSRQSEPDDFASMAEISALARPGSLHCGGTTEYLNRRAWDKKIKRKTACPVKYIHPLLKEVSQDTYGVIIYQEQVLNIMRNVGKLSWEDTAKLRKIMSRSMGVEYFNQYYEKFKVGALENGLKEKEAKEIWLQVMTFGSWAFNKSHSISYGYLSYWTLYLKYYHPAEFFICTLREEVDEDPQKYLLREWVNHFKRKFIPLDIEKSDVTFTFKDGIIYGGFSNIKGIGIKAAAKIIEARSKATTLDQFKKMVGNKNFEILKKFNINPSFRNDQLDLFKNKKLKQEEVKIDYETMMTYIPYADLNPIGGKYDTYYKKHNFKYVKDITDDTVDIRLIGKIKLINLRSMQETNMTQKRKGSYSHPELDKFFNLIIEDDTGTVFIGISRFLYEGMKDEIYKAKVGGIIAIEGKKIAGFYKIQVKKLKVLKAAEGTAA